VITSPNDNTRDGKQGWQGDGRQAHQKAVKREDAGGAKEGNREESECG